MLRLDHKLLVDLGYRSLTISQADRLLKHLYDTMEQNVGLRLAEGMSDEQLDAFDAFFEAKDDAGAFAWLQRNFPDHKEIVTSEFAELKRLLADTADEFNAEAL